MHNQIDEIADGLNASRSLPRRPPGPAQGRCRPFPMHVPIFAAVLALGACVTAPVGPAAVSAGDCPIEMRRQVERRGPPTKSFPIFVRRQDPVCRPVDVSPEPSRSDR